MYANNVSNLDQILSSLQVYVQSSRVRGDVYNLLRQIPSLQPNCGTFAHNDGTTSTLLDLEGTIPIFYRGVQYNIPVEFWIMETYPVAPPVCFVRPTSDMMVKPGHPHVTSEGFVKIPYTTDWRQDFTLVELVAHMCSIFGNMPPVFRRPTQSASSYNPRFSGYNPNVSSSAAYQQSPYYQTQQDAFAQNRSSTTTATSSYNSAQQQQTQPSYGYQNHSTGYTQAESESLFGSNTSQFSNLTPAAMRQEDRTVALKVEITGKIQQELEKMFKRIRDDIDLQFEHQLHLTQSRENVERGIQSLQFLRDDLVKAKGIIVEQDEEVTRWLDEHEAKGTVDPDTILIEGDDLSKQLIKTLAEHQSIEDALYFMDRALSNGEIELSNFLKEVRKLSRKQFMCQALVQKINEAQQQLATPTYHNSIPS